MLGMLLAVAASPPPLQPTNKWVVEYADNECVLSRTYRTTDRPVTLAFTRSPMERSMQVTLLQKSDRKDRHSGPAQVKFGDRKLSGDYGGSYLDTKALRRLMVDLEDVSFGTAERPELVTVDIPGEVQDNFSIPGFSTALEVLGKCVEDLGVEWGFSIEDQQRLAKPATAVRKLEGVFSGNDYPLEAVRDDASGRARVRLLVDKTGRTTDCTILASSGHGSLDAATCRILRSRARFHPAKDIDGKPVRGAAVTSIEWHIF